MQESGTNGASNKEAFFSREDVPPVLETNKYWLLNVLREDLTWLFPVEREGLLKGRAVCFGGIEEMKIILSYVTS